MVFDVIVKNDKYIISAETESNDELDGFMYEGNYRPIKLVDRKVFLEFDYVPENDLHPDVVALICYCAFYSYLKPGKSVKFPFPVSENAKLLFENFNTFTIRDGKLTYLPPVKVENFEDITPYNGNGKSLIAFGGGVDSTSLSLMFPDAIVVNQLDHASHLEPMLNHFEKMKSISSNFRGVSRSINIRKLNEPYGFSGWLNCYLLPLMVAADNGISTVLTGSIMGASYMGGDGKKTSPSTDSQFGKDYSVPHYSWSNLFEKIGIYQFSPICGISELLSSRIVHDKDVIDTVLYCQLNEGKPCHKCSKCFRKNLEFEFWEYHRTGKLRPKAYWERYNNIDCFNSYRENYQYMGHVINFISQSLPLENKPSWFRKRAIFCNANTSFVLQLYQKCVHKFPDHLKDDVMEVLSGMFEVMDEVEVKCFEEYDCSKYAFSDFRQNITDINSLQISDNLGLLNFIDTNLVLNTDVIKKRIWQQKVLVIDFWIDNQAFAWDIKFSSFSVKIEIVARSIESKDILHNFILPEFIDTYDSVAMMNRVVVNEIVLDDYSEEDSLLKYIQDICNKTVSIVESKK